jgi:hypothetical protein
MKIPSTTLIVIILILLITTALVVGQVSHAIRMYTKLCITLVCIPMQGLMCKTLVRDMSGSIACSTAMAYTWIWLAYATKRRTSAINKNHRQQPTETIQREPRNTDAVSVGDDHWQQLMLASVVVVVMPEVALVGEMVHVRVAGWARLNKQCKES